MKKIIIVVVIIIIVGVGAYFLTKSSSEEVVNQNQNVVATTTPAEVVVPQDKTKTVIGQSVEKRDITAYHYGEGSKEILFIAGAHGGYEWNTSLVAFQAMDYLKVNPTIIPADVKVTVIPVLNPDGLNKVVGTADRFTVSDVPDSESETIPGRFNANDVDLNRNFDCDWQADATWQNKTVSGGDSAFSEPESLALKNYIEANNPTAVVAWYSAAGGVFASNCHTGVLPETQALTNTFAKASGYKAYVDFNFYEVTGDMTNWLAKEKIPAISVLLTTHNDVEWSKNQKGIDAILNYYAE